MRLVIGGSGQGKLAYALRETGASVEQVTNGKTCALSGAQSIKILYGLQELVRRLLQNGENVQLFVGELLRQNPDMVMITDEIGCGVVPVDAAEREWREQTGRLCCALAAQARRVDRIFCGLATVIKEEQA